MIPKYCGKCTVIFKVTEWFQSYDVQSGPDGVVNVFSSSQQESQQVKRHKVSMKNRPAARPEKGSWVQEESPDSEAVRPTTSNPPRLSLWTSVCRSLLSLFAPERLLGPLWKPWLWRRTRPVRILSPCKQSDSESRTRGLPFACDLRAGP